MTRAFWLTGLLVAYPCSFAAAQPAIVEIKITPAPSVLKGAVWSKPIVIKSAEDAAPHFGKEELAALSKQVDFKKQIVLVFAWRGSGGDKLEYQILESFPEQVPFSLKLGATDDLRQHTRVFALRNNVRWSIRAPK